MHWILQQFEDTEKLGATLRRMGQPHSFHKVVPFVGELDPPPEVRPGPVLLFGSYTLWRYAARHGLTPGVFRLRPFLHETPWRPAMLNGDRARVMPLRALPKALSGGDRAWFMRPVSDSKEVAGRVWTEDDLLEMASKVLALPEEDIPGGSLRPDTDVMLCPPARIYREWRLWVVDDSVVTWSLYREGPRVVYRPEIDPAALQFAHGLVNANSGYAPAYVMDICETAQGLHLLETNCMNAAGFYAADLERLVAALIDLVNR